MIPGDWLLVALLALATVIAAVALIVGTRLPPVEAASFDWERHCRVRDGLEATGARASAGAGGASDQRERAA